MSSNSKIEWTGDTWQCVAGCDDEGPGCAHCYAKRQAHRMGFNPNEKVRRRYQGLTVLRGNGPQWVGGVRPLPEQLAVPLGLKRGRTIFVNSLSDSFHKELPYAFLCAMFAVMAASPQHTFQVLTKRAENMAAWFRWIAARRDRPGAGGGLIHPFRGLAEGASAYRLPVTAESLYALRGGGPAPWPLPNVHLGASVENRRHGLPRIDHLRHVPAAVRFLSIEPLLEDLGPLDLTGIHWVIVGGESGPGARTMREDWVRSVRDQCAAAGVPFFYKQRLDERGRKVSLPLLDGVQHAAMPTEASR